jgi:rod shape-determining protein MreC
MVSLSILRMNIKKNLSSNDIIVYTSGYGGLFKPGLPVGKIITNDLNKDNQVKFFF